MAQLFAMLVGINATMQQMQSKMDTNARNLMDRMDAHTQAFKRDMRTQQGELQQIGRGLQAGIMATPRAGTNELGGSATAVRPALAAGEDRVIRETCWARRVEVTKTVTVTERGKRIGVTETCTSETRREVTELTETREIEKRLHGKDGVKDARTHTHTQR